MERQAGLVGISPFKLCSSFLTFRLAAGAKDTGHITTRDPRRLHRAKATQRTTEEDPSAGAHRRVRRRARPSLTIRVRRRLRQPPVARRRGPPRLPASVSQPAPRTPITSRLEAPVDSTAPKRRRGRPRKTPAPEPIVESVAEPVFRSRSESAVDSTSRQSPPVRPASPSTDPAWQPRVELRRVITPQRGPETRESEASNADGHPAHQPEAARARAVTRSGRVSRPPLFYGLGGDAES